MIYWPDDAAAGSPSSEHHIFPELYVGAANSDLPIPDQRDILPPKLRQVCSMYKFRSTGWRNVSVSHLLGVVFAAVVVLVAGITTKEEELWSEKKAKQFANSSVGKALVSFFVWTFRRVIEAIEGTPDFVKE